MDIVNGVCILLGICVIIMALGIWFFTNAEKKSMNAISLELSEIRKKQAVLDELGKSCALSNGSLAAQVRSFDKAVMAMDQEVQNFQDHLSRTDKDVTRLTRELSWKRPVFKIVLPPDSAKGVGVRAKKSAGKRVTQ